MPPVTDSCRALGYKGPANEAEDGEMTSGTRAGSLLIGLLLIGAGLVALALGQDWEIVAPFLFCGLVLTWGGWRSVRSGW